MDETSLSDSEVATIDALKSIIDILLNAGVAPVSAFAQRFSYQRDGYLQREMPKAAAMMEMLRVFSTDPKREAWREQLRSALQKPPQGSA